MKTIKSFLDVLLLWVCPPPEDITDEMALALANAELHKHDGYIG